MTPQELNTLTIQQYESLSNSTHHIKDSLHDLDVKYTLLLPYLEQLNQLGKGHRVLPCLVLSAEKRYFIISIVFWAHR